MHRFIILTILFLFVCNISWAEDRSRPVTPEDPFVIGAILPLSGSAAAYGEYEKRGIELAHSELAPEVQKRIKVIFEDDGWDAKRSVSALRKLVSLEKIDAVIVIGSAIGNSVAPIAEKLKIPAIDVGASDFNVVKGRRYTFIHWVIPEVEAQAMVAEIARRKYQRLASLSSEQSGVIAVTDAVLVELRNQNLDKRLVLDERYVPGETDFRTFIAKLKAKQVDGVIVCLVPGSLAAFAGQVKESGLRIDLLGIELFEDRNEVKASKGGLVGQWYVNADKPSGDFVQAYEKLFGEYPGWSAANAYDVLNIIAGAALKHGRDPEKIARYLATLKDYTGATGTYSATGDNRFTLPATIMRVTEGGFEKVYE